MMTCTNTIQHQVRLARTWCCSFLGVLLVTTVTVAAAENDSLRLPDRILGTLIDTSEAGNVNVLTKRQFRTHQYEQTADLLRAATAVLPLRNGGFGQYDAVTALGGGAQHLSFSADGRPLVDLWSGGYNMLQQPPAMMERVEFLYGSDAIGLAPTSTLSTINVQSSIFNTAVPFMSMWYHQGAGDLIAANVTFSQNIAPGLNLTAGVRRSGARGRYQRTDFGLWNVDLQARWTIDQRQSLMLRYGLSTISTQVWGGIDPTSDQSSIEQLARVRFDADASLEEETRRHDLTATYGRRLADDSSSSIIVQGYLSGQLLHRLEGRALSVSPADTSGVVNADATHSGLIARLDQKIGNVRLRLGSHIESRVLDSTSRNASIGSIRPQFFLHGEYRSGALTVRAGARIHSVLDAMTLAVGGGATYQTHTLSIRADVSMSDQEPTAVQRPFVGIPERHTLGVIELATRDEALAMRGYLRAISDPVILRSTGTSLLPTFGVGTERRIAGGSVMSLLTWGNFELRPRLRIERELGQADSLSASLMMLDADMTYVVRTSRNSVRIGLRGAWLPSSVLPSYEALVWSFRQGAGQAPSQIDGLSAYVTALIGNASIRASYENILGNRWNTVLNAPELSRVFRLSVDWSFTD